MSTKDTSIQTPNNDPINQGLVLPKEGFCFHCGEPLPKKPFYAHILTLDRSMCCLGCKLAADSIVEAGLEQYYLDRQEINKVASLPDELTNNIYNHEDIKSQFTYQEDGYQVAELSVIGLRCAACSWLIETRLNKLSGVRFCEVNLTQGRMRVSWREDKTSIGEILQATAKIGYEAKPYRKDTHAIDLARYNKKLLIRLGVAAIGAMQAMMFSIGIYFGDYSGMAIEHRDFLRHVAMIVSVPVLLYSATPFFVSAKNALRARQMNMDVPVSIALILTFVASSYAVISKSGEVYFDSVAMFVFFLLVGRYLEAKARLKAAQTAADLAIVAPKLVTKLASRPDLLAKLTDAYAKSDETIDPQIDELITNKKGELVHYVQAGDVVQVGAGDEIVGDGILLSAQASVGQSLLTGESDLIEKYRLDMLYGGSQNDAQPLVMMVTHDSDTSQLALIERLIGRAASEKPKIAIDADRMAKWFVRRVLLLSTTVLLVWWWIDPMQAIWATVAVLVATCPCALSLATPIALTVSTNRLMQEKFLATRGHTIPTLAKVTHIAFDKTGTLTNGVQTLLGVDTLELSYDESLRYGATLEQSAHHPVAQSLKKAAKNLHLPITTDLVHHAGGGIEAVIEGQQWRIGHFAFALGEGATPDNKRLAHYGANSAIALSCDGKLMACFYFNDRLRTDTKQVLDTLKDTGIKLLMLTGDPSHNAKTLADELSIEAHTGLLPDNKVCHIKRLQDDGAVVLMVGDGINDAPVLAAADVSVAMGQGTDLAQVTADGILLGDELMALVQAMTIAKRTDSVIRQNLKWAIGYNSVVLLPAAFGYVPPWLAAIGMSLSSLLVVLNALRIKKSKHLLA